MRRFLSLRSHNCSQLSAVHEHAPVSLAGWITRPRKVSNKLSFFSLTDANGSTQLVADRHSPRASAALDSLAATPLESVVRIHGVVRKRPSNAQRLSTPTGEIEVLVHDVELLNKANHTFMPFFASDTQNVANEELRAKYRHLDLRRETLTGNLRKRSRVAHAMRVFLHGEGFVEVDTPILLKSTPEGAREFLVPTRVAQSSSISASTSTASSSSSAGTGTGEDTSSTSSSPSSPSPSPNSINSNSNPTPNEKGKEAKEYSTSTAITSSAPQFYSLAQSPQQPKQLLICSGAVDKYFQIARCFRDEDGRKDRQPEFTQVDMEMAFVSWEPPLTPDPTPTPDPLTDPKLNLNPSHDSNFVNKSGEDGWRMGGSEVRRVVEGLVRRVWEAASSSASTSSSESIAGSGNGSGFGEVGAEVEVGAGAGVVPRGGFPVMTYADAMARYGSDKPDTRFGLLIQDLSTLLESRADGEETVECFRVCLGSEPGFHKAALVLAGREKGKNVDGVETFRINEKNHADWITKSGHVRSVFARLEDQNVLQRQVNDTLGLEIGDIVFLSRRKRKADGGSTALGRTRLRIAQLAEDQGTYTPSSDPHLLWVTEFPLFTRADADKEFLAHGRWSSTHHPFTAPMLEDVAKLYSGDIEEVRGQHYDLVLNGVEIGGGSVRVHDADMQEHIFSNILQLDEKEKASFNHLLHALRCGAPPHGGIALGFDRLMAMLCGSKTIRDVIAFPKTGAGTDTFFKSPSGVSDAVLAQYGIRSL